MSGERVTTRRPVQTLARDWLLPGEEMFVLATSREGARSRVRCPSSGADGWIDTSDLEALPPTTEEAVAAALRRAAEEVWTRVGVVADRGDRANVRALLLDMAEEALR